MTVLVMAALMCTPIMAYRTHAESVDSSAAPPVVTAPLYYPYRNYTEVKGALERIALDHPDIAMVVDIGDSFQKTQGNGSRDILALKVSDNVAVSEDEPSVLIDALHHAREWTTTETLLSAAENITDAYYAPVGEDNRTKWLVDNREIWFVPVVNPDGLDYSMSVDEWWRKNLRLNWDNSYGVDLNRNYNGSENGDPNGAWGGAGASHVPSSETYCGMSAFSEPETKAIRDFAKAQRFEVCIDFHSYGNLVMWPWGYGSVTTPDNADFVRIGTNLSALNGYTPQQSVGLYPTTGDSIDWLYGSLDIYAFTFEIGSEFHPMLYTDVMGIIQENYAPILLGIEVAGDREERPFAISHNPLPAQPYSPSGFSVSVNITAARGVNASASRLMYRVDGGAWAAAALNGTAGNDTYVAQIPSQPVGSWIEYYIVGKDLGGVEKMLPQYSPYSSLFGFSVLPASAPPVAEAGPDMTVDNGDSVTFNGTGSQDDVGIVSYVWTFQDAGPRTLTGPTPSYAFENPGSFLIMLTVEDADGQQAWDWVNVTVRDTIPPTAYAGPDQVVPSGSVVRLNSSGSTDNDRIANYTWRFIYDGVPQELYGPDPDFTFIVPGNYTVTLTVEDASGLTGNDTVTITVTEEQIPELGTMLVVVVSALGALLVVFAVSRRRL